MTMLQITFLFIGFFILILVLATIFKRYQRTILWTAAICMFLGVLFSVGFGYIDVIDGDVPNLPVITSIVLIIIGSALLILGAEKLYLKQREKENQSIPVVTSASNAHSADDNATGIVLTGQLKTELAEKVFVTRQAVSRWETGETTPNPETLKQLSALFDVSLHALLGAPRQLICQCCGMPLEESSISKEPDGTPNEAYCKWCYADGTFD